MPGSCAGAVTEVGVFMEATGAGNIGKSPNLDRCDGSTNGGDDINLCVSGMSLVACLGSVISSDIWLAYVLGKMYFVVNGFMRIESHDQCNVLEGNQVKALLYFEQIL